MTETAAAGLPAWSWVDWSLLAVLAVSVVVGISRGFVFECLALAGWVVAWFAAQWLAPEIVPLLPLVPGASAQHGAALALAFVATLLAWGLLARLVRLLLHATPLSLPDRLLGGLFGALRGGALLLALAAVLAWTPAAQSPLWKSAHGAHLLDAGLRLLAPWLFSIR